MPEKSVSTALAPDGAGDTPAGVPIDEGTMKSSKFIQSSVSAAFTCSDDLRNCAIPLGGFWPALCATRLTSTCQQLYLIHTIGRHMTVIPLLFCELFAT